MKGKHAFAAACLLLLIWAWHFLHERGVSSTNRIIPIGTVEKPAESSFDFEPFEPSGIRAVCDATQWTPGLVFTCDESVGGIGNIRNSILHCMRYTIEAGAAFVLPQMVKRADDNIDEIRQDVHVDFEYMFKKDVYWKYMHQACPQMHIYEKVEDVPHYDKAGEKIKLLPEELTFENGETEAPKTGVDHPELWRKKFFKWLPVHDGPRPEKPVIVALLRSYLSFPIRYDPPDFYLNFGRVLEFRDDVQYLADKVLLEVGRRYDMPINLDVPIQKDSFFGVHLRLEHDALIWGHWEWGKFDTQVPAYLNQTSRSNISVIYVASGDTAENAKFEDVARTEYGLPVTTKFQCLHGEDFELLNSLKWDQQALVDFLVLLRATDFAGVGHSSFSWNIALKRHYRYSKVEDYLDRSQILEDEYSVVYSDPRAYPDFDACMWP